MAKAISEVKIPATEIKKPEVIQLPKAKEGEKPKSGETPWHTTVIVKN